MYRRFTEQLGALVFLKPFLSRVALIQRKEPHLGALGDVLEMIMLAMQTVIGKAMA